MIALHKSHRLTVQSAPTLSRQRRGGLCVSQASVRRTRRLWQCCGWRATTPFRQTPMQHCWCGPQAAACSAPTVCGLLCASWQSLLPMCAWLLPMLLLPASRCALTAAASHSSPIALCKHSCKVKRLRLSLCVCIHTHLKHICMHALE